MESDNIRIFFRYTPASTQDSWYTASVQDSDFSDAPPEDSVVVLPPASTNSGDTAPRPSTPSQLEIVADFDVDGDGDIGEGGHLNRDPEACAEPEDPDVHRI